ncbi:hypothetical protein [Clostridium sp. CMCC3677]|uniref:hypothetical protein n=1 Tax=Clostridium sp. CMCC3677 TaxID=2949963 RepID=UPI0013F1383E|nr:hypothetical protein [Clostridium sp. CMCC3677]NFG61358.1 hypothetical protein [Clostridium botulinum]NFQ09171.1 hypothetical protein [Clostridium botulinum]
MEKSYDYEMPRKIINSEGVYNFISLIWSTYKSKTNKIIYLDFKGTKVIEPNMMAPLGLILTKIKSNKNKIFFRNLSKQMKSLLIENGFLSTNEYLNNEIPQNYISYMNFNGDDNNSFREYILSQLREIKSSETIGLLISRLMEIFVNVKMHARYRISKNRFGDKEIFSSGAYYKSDNYLIFSIANNGLTFSQNIKSSIELNYINESEYINWAMQKSNTTRETKCEGPGGLGLYLLLDLIKDCKGKIIIVSGKGFYRADGDKQLPYKVKELNCEFPGTVVTVKVPIKDIEVNDEFNYNNEFNIYDLLKEEL